MHVFGSMDEVQPSPRGIWLKIDYGKNSMRGTEGKEQTVLHALDDLPKEHHHCALLAVNTLQKAINKYRTC